MSTELRLLFVNKDVANFKSKEHRAQVNSFVQKGLKYGKEDRLYKLKASFSRTHYSWRLGKAQHAQSRSQSIVTSAGKTVSEARHEEDTGISNHLHGPPALKQLIQVSQRGGRCFLNDPMCMSALQEQLDPFIRLAGKTTRRERNLLHRYFTVTPAAVYGSSPNAFYCPVLLSAENFVMGVDAADKDMTHLLRKNYLYRSMHSVVSDSRTRHSDDTITALSFAGLIEARAGQLERGREHLVTSKLLIEDRGGIQSMPIALSFPVVTTFLWLGTGTGAFANSHAVERAIETFRRHLLQLHLIEATAEEQRESDPEGRASNNTRYDNYLYIGAVAFGPTSPIRPFVKDAHRDPSVPQQRSHAAILWVLNMMIYEGQHNRQGVTHFLNNFCRYIESSGGSDASNLKAWTVLLALGFYGARHDSETGKGINDSVLRWWEAMDVVELLQLISEKSRARVLRMLSQQLIGGEGSTKEAYTQKQLDQLTSEMRFKWLEARYR